MAYRIHEIEGIGPAFADKLAAASIRTTEDLLAHCGDGGGRRKIAGVTGLPEAKLLKWANTADLMRISGIGGEFAELLEAAGVDTIKELRTRNARSLAEKARQINEAKKLTRAVPSAAVIQRWIEEARTTEPRISH